MVTKELYIDEIKIQSLGLGQDEETLNYWIEKLGFTSKTFQESLEGLSNIGPSQLKKKMDVEIQNRDIDPIVQQIVKIHNEKNNLPNIIIEYGDNVNFFQFFYPFITQAMKRVEEEISLKINKDFIGNYIKKESLHTGLIELLNGLFRMSHRTLILELNVARISGLLKGDSPDERLAFYQSQLLLDKDYLHSFFEEYPVLLRLIQTSIDKWVTSTVNILSKLEKDFSFLMEEFFNGKLPGSVINIETGMGDSHNGGQSVAIIEFTSGQKVVYKPRSLKIDKKYQNVLNWYNKKTNSPKSLYELKIIDQNSYGWVEFIKQMDCKNNDEIGDYYHRLGEQLALLYVLNAVDFHAENIIAHGTQPVLVDLESLFHYFPENISINSASDKAQRVISESVIRTGLLPVLMTFMENNQVKGLDVSGIGDLENQITPKKIPTIVNGNSDEMGIERKHLKLIGSNNNPQLDGQKLDVTKYSNQIREGFTDAYRIIQNNKMDFIVLLNEFTDIQIRHILRPTMRYSDLLHLSYHPDFLRRGIDRDILFHKLWLDSDSFDKLKITGKFEKDALLTNDVPYFYTKPGSLDLYMPDTVDIQIKDFFTHSSLNQVLDKVEKLSSKDLSTQLQLIELSMLAIKSTSTVKTHKPLDSKGLKRNEKSEILNEVLRIAENLSSSAIWSDNYQDVTWIGTRVVGIEENQWKVTPTGPDLYDGLGGIALFFTYLAKTSDNQEYKDISYKALKSILAIMDTLDRRDNNFNIGAFTGLTGYLYVISHFIKLWEDHSLFPYIDKGLKELRRFYLQDSTHDIISGTPGAIIVLLNIYKQFNNEEALELAKKCGERLLEQSVEAGTDGIGWLGVSTRPLSGFSHGNAGCAYALYYLYSVTKDNSFKEGTKKALNYERELYKDENWVDLRDIMSDEDESPAAAAWCHGAPGIILGRTLLKQLGYHDDQIDKEIDRGLEITMNNGFGRDHSLCHGDLGNGEILRAIGINTDNPGLQNAYELVINRVMDEIATEGWKTGMSKNFASPGLMVGIAGIGLGLLKYIAPNSTPSITYLEL